MNIRRATQLGAGRYIQCHGALKEIGAEAKHLGRKAYIMGDEVVLAKTMNKISASLNAAGVEYTAREFDGPCTKRSFDIIADEIKASGCDVIIAVGGGRVLDICKAASEMADIRIITVPTSAATCSAWTVLYVAYSEEGCIESNHFLSYEISAVIADLDVIFDECPGRYIASGIADALAKKPEFLFTMLQVGTEGQRPNVDAATRLADYTYYNYLKIGEKAYRAALEHKECHEVDDIVCCNIMLTGLISDLSTGDKQLAVAHNFYDAVCYLHKDVRKAYLHGELVGLGLALQMSINGTPKEEILAMGNFLKSIDCPVKLEDVGIPTDDATVQALIDYIATKTLPGNKDFYEKIAKGMRYSL
jgi:glycerol dehydrogenase